MRRLGQGSLASQGQAGCGAEGARRDGMGTAASSSQLLMGWGGKYTELQAHAEQSPLIFIKQRVNMLVAWVGSFFSCE